ncbi:MBL fold metallo-hydrolase [Haladaptatus halobius]|uniref:MBL fold metallo-hydrolase n=1 Tax=Haladaptatus halobius TaxID=2884875 RepID=UPI001D0B2AA4|nr:MBL fold metallo-hydrolase [Haladaptatus halobius]
MSEITPDAVSERLEQGDSNLVLLDIRPKDGFDDWHIPGSEHIDVYDDLKTDPGSATEALERLPQGAEIVTVCGVGKVSAVATDVLQEMGYEAITLADGMQGWGRVHRSAPIPIDTGELIQVDRPGTGCLSYIFIADREAIIVDPSRYIDRYEAVLERYGARLTAVLETHAHADHISGAHDLADNHDAPYYLHPADSGSLAGTTDLEDGQQIAVGTAEIDVIHTPGHTEGSVTFGIGNGALLTGDTLFLESVGRPDLEGGDETAVRTRAAILYASLQQLIDKPDKAVVLPAHDPESPTPPTSATLVKVRERNDILDHDQAEFVNTITTNIPETPPNHDQIKRANVGKTTLEEDEARQLELGPNQCAAE